MLAAVGGAMAAGTGAKPHAAPVKAPPVVSGTVVSVQADGTLQSFVIQRSRNAHKVTITVTADTTYRQNKQATTSAGVKVGAKVLVRLAAALKDYAGTGTRVTITQSAPAPAVKHPKTHGTKH